MELGPATVLKVEHITPLEPDVLARRRQTHQRVGVGGARSDRISLRHGVLADRLYHEAPVQTAGLVNVGGTQEVGEGGIGLDPDMVVAIRLAQDPDHGPGHANASSKHLEPRGMVDVLVLVGWIAVPRGRRSWDRRGDRARLVTRGRTRRCDRRRTYAGGQQDGESERLRTCGWHGLTHHPKACGSGWLT